MAKRAKERKPSWLTRFCDANDPSGPQAKVCETCRLYIIETRDKCEWTKWDAGIIEGDDLPIAIILDKPLCRIDITPCTGHPALKTVLGVIGLKADGQYLALHQCFHKRISDRPWKSGVRKRRQDLSFLDAYQARAAESGDQWANKPPDGTLF